MSSVNFRVDLAAYRQMVQRTNETARRNAVSFGNQIAVTYMAEARNGAPWTDQKGVARPGLKAEVSGSGTVKITMGGSAPNYKKGPRSVDDYIEVLEFARGKRFSIIVPVFEDIKAAVLAQFPNAIVRGMRFSLHRDRAWAKRRGDKRRNRLAWKRAMKAKARENERYRKRKAQEKRQLERQTKRKGKT